MKKTMKTNGIPCTSFNHNPAKSSLIKYWSIMGLVVVLSACSGGGGSSGSGDKNKPADPTPGSAQNIPEDPAPTPSAEPTPEPSVEPTPQPSVEPTPEPTVEPDPVTGGPSDFTPQPWEQGLTGLWEIAMAPEIASLIESFTGLADASAMVAPGGYWLLIDLQDQGKIATSSCDTSAPVGAMWIQTGDSSSYTPEEFDLNFPDSPEFAVVKSMMGSAEFEASMEVIDTNNIEVIIKLTKPIPMDMVVSATRSTQASSMLQIGHMTADTLSGGSACSYAQGSSESDFDLHLTSFYEDSFLRLHFDDMSLNNSTVGASLNAPALLAAYPEDTTNVDEVSLDFSQESASGVSINFLLNSADQASFTGNIEIPDLEVIE